MNQTQSHINDVKLKEERVDRPIRFTPNKNIYWDDWGRMRVVFRKDKIYDGVLHSDGMITGCNSYFGVSDYVCSEDITIVD